MNKVIIPLDITPNLAYLLGAFAGDGSIGYRAEKGEYSLKCVGNPLDEQRYYHEVIQPRFTEAFGVSPAMRSLDKGTTFGFRIFSKHLVSYLTATMGLPLGPKHPGLKIPQLIKINRVLLVHFLRGLFDTDGSISFKKKYKDYPYYPVISLSSKSEQFCREISLCLKELDFKVAETYNYKVWDYRVTNGFTVINRIEMNGKRNFYMWLEKIGFDHPKNMEKIRRNIKNIAGNGFEFNVWQAVAANLH